MNFKIEDALIQLWAVFCEEEGLENVDAAELLLERRESLNREQRIFLVSFVDLWDAAEEMDK